jgi:DNA-damage-inducible protein J
MATVTINFCTDEDVKRQATELYKQLGLNMSCVLNACLRQSILRRGIPFDLTLPDVPNAETLAAFAEADTDYGKGGLPVSEFLAEMDKW